VPLIAVTGGIASGKSTVSRRLAEHGAVVVDADLLSREAVAPGSAGLEAIVRRWGPGLLTADGSLDRAALGAIVFRDHAELAALNAIVHPEVGRLTAARMAEAGMGDPNVVIVYDIPLLVEAAVNQPFDLVVTVSAPIHERVRRLAELRGMSAEEAELRVANQATDADREAVADVVIDSSGSLDETIRQADELWQLVKAITPNGALSDPV
jgi:dephospho-CoA kinase